MIDNKKTYQIYRYNYSRPAFFNRMEATYAAIKKPLEYCLKDLEKIKEKKIKQHRLKLCCDYVSRIILENYYNLFTGGNMWHYGHYRYRSLSYERTKDDNDVDGDDYDTLEVKLMYKKVEHIIDDDIIYNSEQYQGLDLIQLDTLGCLYPRIKGKEYFVFRRNGTLLDIIYFAKQEIKKIEAKMRDYPIKKYVRGLLDRLIDLALKNGKDDDKEFTDMKINSIIDKLKEWGQGRSLYSSKIHIDIDYLING